MNIVILGAEFAGLSAAIKLQSLKSQHKITLIDQRESFEYTPALHTCLTQPHNINKIQFKLNQYYGDIYTQAHISEIKPHALIDSNGNEYPYDYLILANGSRTNWFNNKEFQQHCITLKNIHDLTRIHQLLPQSQSVTIIGGGYTGVEIASVLATETTKQIRIIHPRDRLLNNLSPHISQITQNYLKKHSVEMIFNERMTACTSNTITLKSGQILPSDLTFFTAGVLPNCDICPGFEELDEFYRVKNQPNIFICGDAEKSETLPTAQNAMLEGRQVAKYLTQIIKGNTPTPQPRPDGRILAIALGPHDGIITYGTQGQGFNFPYLTGLSKRIIQEYIIWGYKHRITLPL